MNKKYIAINALILCVGLGIILGLTYEKKNTKSENKTNNTNEYSEKDKDKIIYNYKFDEYNDLNIPYINFLIHNKRTEDINNEIREIMLLKQNAQYKYYINNDILTLLITNDDKIIGTYNINIKTHKFMTFKDICDYMNIDFLDTKKYLAYKLKEQKGEEVLLTRSNSYMYDMLQYDKNYYIDENNKINVILNNENITIDNISIPGDNDQTTLDFIIENELYLLGGKKSISEITNKEKVWYAFMLNGGFKTNYLETKEAKELRNAFANSSLSNLDMIMDDITYGGNGGMCYEYSEKSDRFTDVGCHKGIHFVNYKYLKTSEYVKDGNKYTISAKFLWNWENESQLAALFGSYEDAKNGKNPVYKVPEGKHTFTYAEMDEIINNNSIETYHFTFKKEDNQFKLIDFYVTR